ncbi:MAG: sensor histidine kinase [Bacteroidetes bacterium]|jgi:signal transduction histidine kinase|nr:sensor histidine kinase [Bacteroidota bacterium]
MNRLEQILADLHDLKSPLLAIKHLSTALLDQEEMPDQSRRKLRLIQTSAAEAMDTLTKLGESEPTPTDARSGTNEPIDLARLTRDVVRKFHTRAEEKKQTLCCSVASDACYVDADKGLVRKAMVNLVGNAIKFSPQGARVEVRTGRRKDTAYFAVSDNGPGLSEADREQVFQAFESAGPHPTGDEESTGLGLYLVRRIAHEHNGEVAVSSSEGTGSTFTLHLPATEPGDAEASSRTPSISKASGPSPNSSSGAEGQRQARVARRHVGHQRSG